MKYRRLTKEQFEELHKEFINFLATQSITADEWSKLKLEKPKLASKEMDVFSDLVWEGVLLKVKYLENISSKHMYLFQVLNNSISLKRLSAIDDSQYSLENTLKYLNSS